MIGADRDQIAAGGAARELDRRRSSAVEPSLVNFTISAPSTSDRNASAHASSSGAGRVKLVPSSSDARTASTTRGYAWPSVTAREPMPYSMNWLPSTSHTWQPWPRAISAGASSGYWSSPLA